MQNTDARNNYHWSLFAMFMSACRPYEQREFEGLMKPFYVMDSEVMR